MAPGETVTEPSAQLLSLPGRLQEHEGFCEVVAGLRAGAAATLDGAWGSACALAAAALGEHAPGPLVVVCPRVDDVDEVSDDLRLFAAQTPEIFPAWESMPGESRAQDGISGDRTRVLKLLQGPQPPKLVIASIQALLQPVPDPESLARNTRTLRVGTEIDLGELAHWLAEHGFHGTTAVALPGEMAIRGGILDLFAADWHDPVRVEFFGDRIESIRRFEVSSQRSLGQWEAVDLSVIDGTVASRGHLASYVPRSGWFFLIEPQELEEHARHYVERLDRPGEVHDFPAVMEQVARFGSVTASAMATLG